MAKKCSSRTTGHLLTQPYHELYAEIQAEVADYFHSHFRLYFFDCLCDSLSSFQASAKRKSIENALHSFGECKENLNSAQKLWVEEYRPQNFIQLLSDDVSISPVKQNI